MKRLIREPLLHFFLLGALLFGLYGELNRHGFNAPNEIVVTHGQVNVLQAQFQRLWQRPPTPQELQGLVDNWVREEILYREGLAMRLDRDDPVVRRRIEQKVEFIADSALPAAPTTEELQRWLDRHPNLYRVEPSYSLRQVYFDPARHVQLGADIAAAQRALVAGRSFAKDPTLLPGTLDGSAAQVAGVFGSAFADALRSLPMDTWQGPIQSAFGLHLVRLTARRDDRPASLADVRAEVERDLVHARTQDANTAFYDKLRANYTVRIEDSRLHASRPAG